ncbi:MAG: ATP-binding cassette domain-containing protein, partial [Mycobacterium sp.]|nr:ATP-binding cassette domain-containing protein [Mycobacterium sp.]
YGEMTLTVGLTALLLAPEVFWPLRRVGAAFHSAQDGKTAVEAAFQFIDAADPPPSGARYVRAPLTVQVDDPDLSARPGRVTVLTGPNGIGKSTLLQAILGMGPGRIAVNGIDVAELDLPRWWSQVAWLAQRPVLVPGTVLANLELFGPLPDLRQACRDAAFDDVVAELPDGLDTVLGRGGVGLSLGQRQRLGLARVLGSAAPVLLLDEPTAHLDGPTEDRVLRAIAHRASRGATVLVVGHRDPVLAIGDVVVSMGAAHVPQ